MALTSLSINRAGINDAAQLTDLGVTTFVAAYAAHNTAENLAQYLAESLSLETISAELLDTGNIFFMVYSEKLLVGYAKLRSTELPNELVGYSPIEIERIYVLQNQQHKKIGSAIIAHCRMYAQANGYNVLWLGVWEHNLSAIAFYKKMGFEVFGSHLFRFGAEDQTDLLMKLCV